MGKKAYTNTYTWEILNVHKKIGFTQLTVDPCPFAFPARFPIYLLLQWNFFPNKQIFKTYPDLKSNNRRFRKNLAMLHTGCEKQVKTW